MFSAIYSRCCEFQTAAVNPDGQAYDAKGYCTFSEAMGGSPGATCQEQIVSGFSNTTLMILAGGLALLLLLGSGMGGMGKRRITIY